MSERVQWDGARSWYATVKSGDLRALCAVHGGGRSRWWRVEVTDRVASAVMRHRDGEAKRAGTARVMAEKAAHEAIAHVIAARGGA